MYEKINEFLEDMRRIGMAENTITAYEIHLRHYYSFCKQFDIKYKEVKIKQLKEYIEKSLNTGDSRQTVNARLSAIKKFYNYLIEMEEIEYNPVVNTLFLKGRTTKTQPLTEQEKRMILGYFEEKSNHINLAFKTLFCTGLRVSELVKLEKKDIQIINDRAVLHIRDTKGGNERYVPVFGPEVAEELLCFKDETETEKIFKVSKRDLQYHAKKCGDDLGIYFTIHQTRHTFATEKLREGMRIDILQKILGHKDISTTMLYARTANVDVINSAQPLERRYDE